MDQCERSRLYQLLISYTLQSVGIRHFDSVNSKSQMTRAACPVCSQGPHKLKTITATLKKRKQRMLSVWIHLRVNGDHKGLAHLSCEQLIYMPANEINTVLHYLCN